MGNVIFSTMNPGTDRRPGVRIEFNFAGGQGLPAGVRRVLYVGQKLAAGSAAPNVPIQVFAYADAEPLVGRGSMLAEMIRYGKMAEDYYDGTVETWVVPLADNGAGVAASGSISFQGSAATANGTLMLYIAGTPVPVLITNGQTAAQIATAVVAAIAANTQLPVTAAVDGVNTYQVNLTCKWKGETGNFIDVRFNYRPTSDYTPAGVVIAAVTGLLTGGTQNPDITAVFTAIGDEQFTDIAMPYTDAANLTTLQNELEPRWGGGGDQADGTGWAAFRGTASATNTFGQEQDSQFLQVMGTSTSPTPPYLWAAVMAEVYSISLEIDPAQPLQYLVLPNVLAPAKTDVFTGTEQKLALFDGISTYSVDRNGTVRTQTVITTWQTNGAGSPDTSYLYPEYVANLSYQRYAMIVEFNEKFPRFKWSGVELSPLPPNVATPNLLRSELQSLGQDFQDDGLITNAATYASNAVIETAEGNNQAAAIVVDPTLIAGLRGIFVNTQFSE